MCSCRILELVETTEPGAEEQKLRKMYKELLAKIITFTATMDVRVKRPRKIDVTVHEIQDRN